MNFEKEKPNNYNHAFMQRAIILSEIAYKRGNGLPIECVIVRNGKIIGEGHNEIFSRSNPTAHGEMVAIETLSSGKFASCLVDPNEIMAKSRNLYQ